MEDDQEDGGYPEQPPDKEDAIAFAGVQACTPSGATNPFLVQFGTDGDGTDWNGAASYRPPYRDTAGSADCDDPESLLIAKEGVLAQLDDVLDAILALS